MEKILLLEEDTEVRNKILENLGNEYHFETAATVEEARDILNNNSFDALFFDAILPDGSGLKLLREFRLKGLKTPALITTTLPEKKVYNLLSGTNSICLIKKPLPNVAIIRRKIDFTIKMESKEIREKLIETLNHLNKHQLALAT